MTVALKKGAIRRGNGIRRLVLKPEQGVFATTVDKLRQGIGMSRNLIDQGIELIDQYGRLHTFGPGHQPRAFSLFFFNCT